MKNILDDSKRIGALMTMLVLSVGAISIVGTSQIVRGSDGGNINGSIVACVYGACKDNTFNGGTSSGGGGGSSGQPTPTTATVNVIKKVDNTGCTAGSSECKAASDFQIKVTATNVSPSTPFQGEGAPGTKVTLDAGQYTVEEVPPFFGYAVTFEGNDCQQVDSQPQATGTIAAGDTQTCTVVNTFIIG